MEPVTKIMTKLDTNCVFYSVLRFFSCPQALHSHMSHKPYKPVPVPGWLVAHRAACLDAPENSVEAVRLAAKTGAKWIEFDVSFSSDLSAVAFHDDTLDRVTLASGQVNSLTYTQLSKLDLAPRHPLSASYNNVKIPSVEEFVSECISLDLKMIIDLKTWELPDETVNLILSLHKQFPTLKTNSIITSFFPNLLYKLRS